MARGLPLHLHLSAASGKFWRGTTGLRDSEKVGGRDRGPLVRDHQVGFFILADEEPNHQTRRSSWAFLQELIGPRGLLSDEIKWGHLHPRHRHPARHRRPEVLPARPVSCTSRSVPRRRRSLKARSLQQGDHDRGQQARTPRAARPRTSFVEAQFIVGLRTRPPRRWRRPTRWRGTGTRTSPTGRCTRPGSISPLFQELGATGSDLRFRHSKYSCTPIIKSETWSARAARNVVDEQLPALLT